MKIIAQDLDARQGLLDLQSDLQQFCEEMLTDEQLSLYQYIKVIEGVNPIVETDRRMGRPSYSLYSFRRALIAMNQLRFRCIEDLRNRLKSDMNLRLICGFGKVPSKATFSRKIHELAGSGDADRSLDRLIKKIHGGSARPSCEQGFHRHRDEGTGGEQEEGRKAIQYKEK